VTRLVLSNFRSYASGELVVSGAPVVLAGPNGAGKTNLLDAISLLSPGRGLRGAKLSEHTRKGPAATSDALWGVGAQVSRGGEIYDIGTGLTLGPNCGERRQVHLNGAPATSTADIAEVVQILWLTPAMDRLFLEGRSERRAFLDRLVFGFDAGHARLDHGRHVRDRRQPPGARNREHLQLRVLGLAGADRRAHHMRVDRAGHQVGGRRRPALVLHVLHRDAGLLHEHLADEMGEAAVAGGAEIERARPRSPEAAALAVRPFP
jgi:energy-coupling factor transporter ATP-binding protein EcfA2